jgi:DNA-binding response OmpR family regulator
MSGIYTFERFRLDAAERLFFVDGTAVTLPPKVFDTLLMLAANAGRVLSKERSTRSGRAALSRKTILPKTSRSFAGYSDRK